MRVVYSLYYISISNILILTKINRYVPYTNKKLYNIIEILIVLRTCIYVYTRIIYYYYLQVMYLSRVDEILDRCGGRVGYYNIICIYSSNRSREPG